MPFPLALLALALTAGGMGANAIGARKADRAQADVMAAERTREKGRNDETKGINEGARRRYQDVEGQTDQKAAGLEQMYLEGADDAPPISAVPTDSNITVKHEADEKAKSREYTDQQGAARAKLMSFGDLFGDIGRSEARDAGVLGRIQGERVGSQGVLPMELDAAQGEGAGWRLGGDIMSGLGSVASMGALGGGGGMLGGFTGAGSAPLAGTNMLAKKPGPLGGLLSLFR